MCINIGIHCMYSMCACVLSSLKAWPLARPLISPARPSYLLPVRGNAAVLRALARAPLCACVSLQRGGRRLSETKACLCSSVSFAWRWWESAAPLIVFGVLGQGTLITLSSGKAVGMSVRAGVRARAAARSYRSFSFPPLTHAGCPRRAPRRLARWSRARSHAPSSQ